MGVIDPITAVFGAHGEPSPGVLDLAVGSLRQVPALDKLWAELDVPPPNLSSYPGTQGTHELMAAVHELSEFSLHPIEGTVVTHGAIDGLAHALSVLPPDSSVVFAEPGWAFAVPVARAGMTAVPVLWNIAEPVAVWLDRVATAAHNVAGQEWALLVNFPRNPSGAVATPEVWEAIAALPNVETMTLVIDNVYGFLAPPSPPTENIERVVVVDSLSKRMGAPGLRLGWVSSSVELMPQIRASMAQTSVGVSGVVAATATAAIRDYLARDIGAEVTTALADRRSDLRGAAQTAGVADRLVLADTGLYASVRVDRANVAGHISAAAGRGIRLSGYTDEHHGYLRFCVGSTDTFGPVVDAIRDAIHEVER